MKDLEISSRIIRANDLVKSGKYDPYAILFYREKMKVEEIALRTAKLSGITGLPDWVDIVMPICEYCGRIATTRVTDFDGSIVEYTCDKDVKYTKGCGYKGRMRISNQRYKLFWRLDWPSRQDFLKVSAELAGIDHHTLGSSWTPRLLFIMKYSIRRPQLDIDLDLSSSMGKSTLNPRHWTWRPELLSFVPLH